MAINLIDHVPKSMDHREYMISYKYGSYDMGNVIPT